MRVGHLMYAPDFRRLKGRLAAIDHSQLDPNILGFLVKANCSDELVTIWSCEGHKGSRRWNTGYVMFGVRDQDHIYKLYDLIRKEFGEHQHLVGLTMTTRLNFTIPKNPRTGLYEWFAVWNLSWKKNTKFTREQGWAAIEAAGVNFLNWLEGPRIMS